MTYLYAILHTLGVNMRDRVETAHHDTERGASTIEIVFWAVALLALAGIVYAAINAYINNKLPGIN
jgi:ABC-type dipeptide/oligopeptide/nickel transport system permease component